VRFIKSVTDWRGLVVISAMLAAFWFLMSPKLAPANLIMGVACALGITFFWSRDLFRPGHTTRFNLRQLVKLFVYLAHLGWNMFLSGIVVARIVLDPKMPISPGFILLQTKLQKDLTRVLYANSITLTPGTITVDLNGDRLLVHAITEEAAKGVSDWYMHDKMRDIELSGP
jgi:multicomponent Na+:H+ antiporter subunit E